VGAPSDLRICVAVTSPYRWDRGVTRCAHRSTPGRLPVDRTPGICYGWSKNRFLWGLILVT